MTTQTFTTQASFKRWWRNATYLPWRSRHYFNKAAQDQIEQAVTAAEHGHHGEIVVVVEGSLPLAQAYSINTRQRALQLFAESQVWDTEYNSGVLLYLNICEHRIELLADRGIHAFIKQDDWQAVCDQVTQALKKGQMVAGVLNGVEQIGALLQAFYVAKENDRGNERSNRPIIL